MLEYSVFGVTQESDVVSYLYLVAGAFAFGTAAVRPALPGASCDAESSCVGLCGVVPIAARFAGGEPVVEII